MTTPHLISARDHCLAPSRTVDAPIGAHAYGRMFPDLPPLVIEEALLWTIGDTGGACDSGPVVDTEGGDDARAVAAGWPFFGQFVAHDITADRSLPAHQVDATTCATPVTRRSTSSGSTVTARPEPLPLRS